MEGCVTIYIGRTSAGNVPGAKMKSGMIELSVIAVSYNDKCNGISDCERGRELGRNSRGAGRNSRGTGRAA